MLVSINQIIIDGFITYIKIFNLYIS